MSPLGPIPDGWKLARFRDVTSKIGSGATPRGGEAGYRPTRSNYALIRSQNVLDRRFSAEGLAFISDTDAESLRSVELREGDILLNITGDGVTFGRACAVPRDILPAVVNQHVSIIRVRQDLALPGFVLSYLTHPVVKAYVESFNAGGSRRAITKGHIESFALPLPPLHEQLAIAASLGVLDDKIELNRRMNATLEAMARAIFKSWFVDFDPARAKAEGREPIGMNSATATLFPDSFEDSSLGEIPKGWAVRAYDESFEILSGGTPKTSVQDYWDGDILWFSVVETPSDVYVVQTEKRITEAGLENSAARLLPKGTTIVTARGTVGKCAIVGRPMAMNQSCYGLRGRAAIGSAFTYFVISHLVTLLQQRAHGSVFDTITRDTFASLSVVVPSEKLLFEFEDEVKPLLERVLNNLHESHTLAALRDTVLPKLLSGEIRVKDAEKFVSAAT